MRKYKLFIGIFILVGVLIFGAIWHVRKADNLGVSQITLTEWDGLTIGVKSVDYSEKTVTLLITNDNEYTVRISPFFCGIERKKDSVWYRLQTVDGMIHWPMIPGVRIHAGETKELPFIWSKLYGTLGSGTYRIWFEFNCDEADIGYMGAEFTLNGWKELFPLFS